MADRLIARCESGNAVLAVALGRRLLNVHPTIEGFSLNPATSPMTDIANPNLIIDINYLNIRTEVRNKEILFEHTGTLM